MNHFHNQVILILICLTVHHATTEIPTNWKKYIAKEMLDKYQGKPTEGLQEGNHFQGDITGIDKDVLSDAKDIRLNNVINDKEKRWIDGVVPYVLGESFNDPDRVLEKSFILLAMELISSSTSRCITFVPWTNQPDHLLIARGLGCSSSIGRQGGRQTVSLTRGCLEEIGSIQHELFHALGFFHEMSRVDRDDYVWINWKNLIPGFRKDFEIRTDGITYGLPYDYESIMHYRHNAFALDPLLPTILPKVPGQRIGQSSGLSITDILKLRKGYSCPGSAEIFFGTVPSTPEHQTTIASQKMMSITAVEPSQDEEVEQPAMDSDSARPRTTLAAIKSKLPVMTSTFPPFLSAYIEETETTSRTSKRTTSRMRDTMPSLSDDNDELEMSALDSDSGGAQPASTMKAPTTQKTTRKRIKPKIALELFSEKEMIDILKSEGSNPAKTKAG